MRSVPPLLSAALAAAVLGLGGGCAGEPSRFPDDPVGSPPDGEATPESTRTSTARQQPTSPTETQSADSRSETPRTPGLSEIFPNRRLSLDFQKTGIRRIMRVFREESTVSIVLAPEVDGRLTVSVEDVPVADAFRTVLETADLRVNSRRNSLFVEPRPDDDE